MKKLGKFVGIAAAVVVLGLVAVGAVAFAQGPEGESDGSFNYYERFRQTLAGILGISVEEYDSAVEQAQGQVLDEAVTEGWLTQDQADRMRDRMEQAPGMGPWGMKGGGRHGRGMEGWGTNLVSIAAEELGMDQADLVAELQAGRSIADVASEKGVDPQAIADAYLAQLGERLSQAVENGRITQDQADSMLEQAREHVTDQLNGTWEGCGPRGFHGMRGTPPEPESSSEDSL